MMQKGKTVTANLDQALGFKTMAFCSFDLSKCNLLAIIPEVENEEEGASTLADADDSRSISPSSDFEEALSF